jgi:hypothetical protein
MKRFFPIRGKLALRMTETARLRDKHSGKRRRRQTAVDLVAVVALLAFVVAASAALTEAWNEDTSPTAVGTSVRW